MDKDFDHMDAQIRDAEAAGRFDLAADLRKLIFESHPQNDDVLAGYVEALLRLGKADKALDACDRAIAMMPTSSYPWRKRAVVQFNFLNNPAAAEASLKAGLEVYPSDAESHLMLADLSFQTLDFDAARHHGSRAAEIGDSRVVLRARHRFLDDHEGAVEVAFGILAARPTDVEALTQCGISLFMLGRLEEGASYLYRAAEHEPHRGDVIFPLANILLLLGDTKAGWRHYEMLVDKGLLTKSAPPVLTTYHDRLWRGQSLENKRILVLSYLGLGDSLMYARYARSLKAAGAHVTFCVRPELKRLFNELEGVDNLLTAWPVENWSEYDYWIFDNLLPPRFGASEGNVPARLDGYIKLRSRVGTELPTASHSHRDRLRIGLCWDTAPTHFTGRARSLAPEDLQPLAEIANVDWFALQKRPVVPDFTARSGLSIVDHSHDWTDFYDAAVFASTLDLTISICSAPIHLAGALGLPAWVMVGAPEWRWGRQGDHSPWYPHVRIFRQMERGGWRSVTEAVRVALELERGSLLQSYG
ncbi:hypothetical protein LMG19083_04672 [Ralstonia psammae]|uniref:Tetratricopeptide repeat protein n=1 Tax=Ralstonia psammae TaxID=3058598 RepID=A0ABN9JDP7_9RALS|nr:tetratricopeptide repeat protein [Ralstonia sp. LMG 19083]CAJ0808212.1 hypothetical protein LMG19083_04672 [Ralstonia sp. LMG 19083]